MNETLQLAEEQVTTAAVDDPLLQCLMVMAQLHELPASQHSPVAGLPLQDGRLTPGLFPRAAKRLGLRAKVVQRELAAINHLLLPVILLLEDDQVCILQAIDERGQCQVIYPDNPEAAVKADLSALQAQYSGFAILASPVRELATATRASEEKIGHWFWSTLSMSWRIYRDVLIASLLVNLFAIVNPLFIMNVYDRVVPNNAKETLWVLAIGVAVVFVFDFGLRLLRSRFIDLAGKKSDVILSSRLMEKVLGMKYSARPSSAGQFANNFREFDGIREFITSATITALIDLPFVLIFLGVIYLLGGPLVLVPLLAIPVILIYGFIVQSPLRQAAEQASRAAAEKSGLLVESLTIPETVKARAAESYLQSRWEKAVGHLARWDARSRLLSSSASGLATFVQQLVMVSVVVYGVYLINTGLLSMGGLIAAVMLSSRAIAPMAQVAMLTTRYHQSRAALQTLNDMMAMPVERPEGKHYLSRPVLEGEIRFDDVTFRYPGGQTPALKNASFLIRPGEKVGLIGRIGSGKSTVEKLLLGLYEADSGSVHIDGVDIRQLDPADLRRNVGYMPQDISLLNASLRENITIGTANVSDADILNAAAMAGIDSFANQHPLGFEMQVGERGEQLSGGQRQAVALARAVVGKPPLLLFDEPTSAMDNSSEERVRENLAELLKERTLILVTHRASLLKLVDRLIVMDAGMVVADGPKEQVLAALQQGRIKTGG